CPHEYTGGISTGDALGASRAYGGGFLGGPALYGTANAVRSINSTFMSGNATPNAAASNLDSQKGYWTMYNASDPNATGLIPIGAEVLLKPRSRSRYLAPDGLGGVHYTGTFSDATWVIENASNTDPGGFLLINCSFRLRHKNTGKHLKVESDGSMSVKSGTGTQ